MVNYKRTAQELGDTFLYNKAIGLLGNMMFYLVVFFIALLAFCHPVPAGDKPPTPSKVKYVLYHEIYISLCRRNNTGIKAWVPVEMLGNPFDKVSSCGEALAKQERLSSGVAKFRCEPVHVAGQ